MNMKYLFILSIALLSCSENSGRTPERNYYIEIRTLQGDNYNKAIAEFLRESIPQKKYTITNGSSQAWPYYFELELDENISKDSLMSPHWYIHRMILKDSSLVLTKDDYLVRIDLMPDPDTIPNYLVQIYEIDSSGYKLSATSGIHFVDTAEFYSHIPKTVHIPSHDQLYDHYLKSIIRYSFK
jgi:hypothetical protein